NLCAHLLPAKLLRAHWTSLREPPARSLVAQQVHDGPGELLVPLWWRQKTIHPIANHAAKAWNVRGHHGGSAGKRLQQHDALTLTTGVGRAKDICRPVESRKLLSRDTARKVHVAPSLLRHVLLKFRAQPAISGDDKACIGEVLPDERKGAQEVLGALALLKTAQIQNVQLVV